MKKENFEIIINNLLKYDIDFAETYYEKTKLKSYEFEDSKLYNVITSFDEGIGIRCIKGDAASYAYSNEINSKSIEELISNLEKNYEKCTKSKEIKLKEEKIKSYKPLIPHDKFVKEELLEFFKKIDKYARSLSDKIVQVQLSLAEKNKKVKIANSESKYVKEDRNLTRLYITVVAKENDKTAKSYSSYASSGGYELLNTFNMEEVVKELAESAIKKLYPVSIKGGMLPVIIESGFGAVIFHEACGHAMEATTVSKNISVLSGRLGEKIASDKVNIVDDGTLDGFWGSTVVDDEGNKTKRNVLIENGILKGYLIDKIGSIRMNMETTGSSRRQDYTFMPTSRMNNTYLLKGSDKIEDMIKSIDYGVYAKEMGGGSVDPTTGDFNFATNEAYLIENGKIGPLIKSVSLIGNTLDILKNVEMVSDDLEYGVGMCGSDSGSVPVSLGQPTIKVSEILVGGDK